VTLAILTRMHRAVVPPTWRPALRSKLVAGYAALLGSMAGFIYLYFPGRLETEATAAIAQHAHVVAAMTAHAVSPAMIFDDGRGVEEAIAGASAVADVRYVVVIDAAGNVMSAADIGAARRAGYRDIGSGPISPEGTYRAAAPVLSGGDTLGTVYLGVSLERLHRNVVASREHIALVSVLIFLAGLVCVAAISVIVTGPLARIVRVVERVSEGDLSGRVGSMSRDEVGYLARAFDSMIHSLSVAYGELQAANRGLEERVDARTQELRREVEERRHAQDALKQSEQRFRTMFESAAMGIALLATDETILEVNPALLDMLGCSREVLIGRSFETVLGGDGAIETMTALRDLVAAGHQRFQGEVQLRTPAAPVWAHVVVSAIHDGDDSVRYALAMFENISGQKQLAEQLRQAQKLEAVGRLAGGVAHDFNNLLTTINGVTKLMLDDLRGAEWLRSDLEHVHAAGERAAGLTQQLLAFSRRQMLQPRVIDLNVTVREVAAMLDRIIGEDIRVIVDLDPELGHVRADPGQMTQVLMNLAVNARDAMQQGGELRFVTSNVMVDEATAERCGTAAGPHVVLTVLDTGHGMDAETRRNIFEPFFTTKPVGKGTGLGLATVYGIVKQSGGGIEVETAPNEGALFRIFLPRATRPDVLTPYETKTAAMPTGCETVLLVEDELAVRRLVGRVLRQSGYTVLETSNCAEAIEIARNHDGGIDGVLTDVVMPDMSGPRLVEQLVLIRPELKVLYMSGYTRDEIDQQGLSTGSFGFIQKPMSPAALTTAIREVLDAPAPVLAA
jgi:PAS domain S-box-containing protein